MVDLVKIRKKARERREESEAPEAQPAPVVSGTGTGDESPRRERARSGKSSGRKKRSSRRSSPASSSESEPVAPDLKPEASPLASEPPASSRPPATKESSSSRDRLEEYKRTVGRSLDAGRSDEDADEEDHRLELLTFVLAGEHYAVEIERIVEITPPRRSTRIPNSEESILGIISLRGTIVTILDLRRMLGHPPLQEGADDPKIVVVACEGDHSGFLVDRVSRVIKMDPDRIEVHPVVSISEQSEFIRGVFDYGEELNILLDLDRLCAY